MRNYSSVAAATTLSAPISDSQTTIAVTAAVGYPASYPFTLVIDPGLETEEIVSVTNAVGTSLTVVRGEDASAAISHGSGAVVRHMVTGRDLREPQQHIAATNDVHGVDGNLADFIAAMVPVGSAIPFFGSDPGENWLVADGSDASRSEYPTLFGAIGTTYGEGDGTTTFGLPDMRGRVAVGKSSHSSFNELGKTGGSLERTLTEGNLPSHTHTASTAAAGAHTHTGTTGAAGAHTHGVSHNAASIYHRHSGDGYALISPTAGGNMYFKGRNGPNTSLTNRIDGTFNGATSNRTNFVEVQVTTGDARSLGGSWDENASITTASSGSHSHSFTTGSSGSHAHDVTVNATGDGTAFSIVQPYMAADWIIKAR